MVSCYQFPVAVIEIHAGNVRVKYVLQDPDWFSCLRIPDFDGFLPCYVEFESDWRKKGALDGVIIRGFRNERFCVLENLKNSRTTNKSSMFGYNSKTCYIKDVCNVESLATSIVRNIPNLDHSLGVASYKGIHI